MSYYGNVTKYYFIKFSYDVISSKSLFLQKNHGNPVSTLSDYSEPF